MGAPSKEWTARKHSWPNGRAYWVVGVDAAYGTIVIGKGGGETKFYDKSQAQSVADEMNCLKQADDCPVGVTP